MSSTGTPDPRGGEAIEYVLGTLDQAERAAFERDLPGDPALAATVHSWEDLLASLAIAVPSVEPKPELWRAIEAAIGPSRSATIVPFPTAADVSRLRRSRSLWRGGALAAGAIAAVLALLVAAPQFLPQPQPPALLAVVNRSGELPALLVRVDQRNGIVQVRSLAAETPPDRSLELWSLVQGEKPRSLGLLGTGATRVSLPAGEAARLAGATIAVSVEPKGGSTTGAPTGAVVYSGKLVSETP